MASAHVIGGLVSASPTVEVGVAVRATVARTATRPEVALDFELAPGVRGVVGTVADGVLAIAPLIAGSERARRGGALVFGRDPAGDPGVRARIGATFDEPLLLDAPTVSALLTDVDRLRGGDGAKRALAELGLASWSTRRTARLDRSERRALELMIALSTPDPLAIVLTEPTVDVAILDRTVVARALGRAADRGACALVASASIADALSLAPVVHLLEAGKLGTPLPADHLGAFTWRGYLSLRVESDLPRLLVTALTDDPSVTGIAWDQGAERSIVTVHGPDLDALALAVAAAAAQSGAAIRSIVPVTADLDQIRARASGAALAAYQAGYRGYWTSAATPTPPGPSPAAGPP